MLCKYLIPSQHLRHKRRMLTDGIVVPVFGCVTSVFADMYVTRDNKVMWLVTGDSCFWMISCAECLVCVWISKSYRSKLELSKQSHCQHPIHPLTVASDQSSLTTLTLTSLRTDRKWKPGGLLAKFNRGRNRIYLMRYHQLIHTN